MAWCVRHLRPPLSQPRLFMNAGSEARVSVELNAHAWHEARRNGAQAL